MHNPSCTIHNVYYYSKLLLYIFNWYTLQSSDYISVSSSYNRQERNERNAGRGRDRGSGGRGPVRGRGRGRGHGEKMSTADLDADLEKYHKEAMQIN